MTPEAALELLDRLRPQAALVVGPSPWPGDRMELAQRYALRSLLTKGLRVWPPPGQKLTVAMVRGEVHQYAMVSGMAPRLLVLVLDGASSAAQNALLKLLEEPPETTSFLLLAAHMPLATIASRCTVIRIGITWEAVPEGVDLNPCQTRATDFIKALGARDPAGVRAAMETWGDGEHEALQQWACEAVSQRWRFFCSGHASRTVALALLKAWRQYGSARPRVADRAAADFVLEITK